MLIKVVIRVVLGVQRISNIDAVIFTETCTLPELLTEWKFLNLRVHGNCSRNV